MSIEREVEKPRKDYEKYSDVKNAIIFFYNDYYDAMVNDINDEQVSVEQNGHTWQVTVRLPESLIKFSIKFIL